MLDPGVGDQNRSLSELDKSPAFDLNQYVVARRIAFFQTWAIRQSFRSRFAATTRRAG